MTPGADTDQGPQMPVDEEATQPSAPVRRWRGRGMKRAFNRLAIWGRRHRVLPRLELVLAILAVLAGGATYAAFTGFGTLGRETQAVLALLYVDVVLMVILVMLVARRVVKLRMARARDATGSRLHVRLVMLFSVVAMVPTVLMAVFSALFFTFGVQSWFGEKVYTAIEESREVAEAYLSEHNRAIVGEALAMANDISREWLRISTNRESFNAYLSAQSAVRGLSEAVVFTQDGRVIGQSGYLFSLQAGEEVPLSAIARARGGEVAVVEGEQKDRVRALVKLNVPDGPFLYAGRFIDPKVLDHVARTEEAADAYQALEGERSDLEVTFILLFLVIALMLLMAAIWFGMTLATELAEPVRALLAASRKVSEGDLTVQVPEAGASDELSSLSRAFNRMTLRLRTQQTELISAKEKMDARARFTETVLAGVSAGVIGTDAGGRITLANASAATLLDMNLSRSIGSPLLGIVPEFDQLLLAARETPSRAIPAEEVRIRMGDQSRVLRVGVAAERVGDPQSGFVFTFDDITDLQSAQRMAAWADVARRIAHEIKNPLTPIQLSAERLKRKYIKSLNDDPKVFEECTDTIIRHVSDIGQMVDEFSSFARMPRPTKTRENLGEVVQRAAFLQRTAWPQITFDVDVPPTPMPSLCDARQMGQALVNLLKNAVEAVDARIDAARGNGDTPQEGRIAISLEAAGSVAVIRIVDNGVGLPRESRDRLMEPYITTREKGTGLGLAIVKKILEDHDGSIELSDAPGGQGAQVTIRLPVAPADAQTTNGGSLHTTEAGSGKKG